MDLFLFYFILEKFHDPQTHHIPLEYMCLIKKIDHKMFTYIRQLHMQKSIKCMIEGGLEEHKCLQDEEILLAQGVYTGFRVSRYEKNKVERM